MNELNEWARRHSIPERALIELAHVLSDAPAPRVALGDMSETVVQQQVRLEAPKGRTLLWRNNVGVAFDDKGVPIRYGLANDSKKLNAKVKSSDLIGVYPLRIAPYHVGKTVGVFIAAECKRANWRFTNTPHDVAQRRYHHIVKAQGGIAGFVRNVVEYREMIVRYVGGGS